MMVIDLITGKKANFGSKKTIIEAFKKNRLENINFEGKDDLQYKVKKNNILRFY
jgi:penicillin-binding protein 1A